MPNLEYIEVLLRDPRIEVLEGSAKFAGLTVKLQGFHSKVISGKQLSSSERRYVEEVTRAVENITERPLTINGQDVSVRFGAPPVLGEHFEPQILEKK